METIELLKRGRTEEAWQRCCGFIDLSLGDVMAIQRRLLLEQVEVLKRCELGRYIMNGTSPRTVEEFRESVPLTTYDDYAPYLLERREKALPRPPALWQYTSGKSGEYSHRWAPVTREQLREIEPLLFALAFFSSCKGRNDIALRQHDKVLYGMAPPPYATGTMARAFPREMFDFLPPISQAEVMPFDDRMQRGFEMALSEGLDVCFALSSVAVAIGDRFRQSGSSTGIRPWLKRPRALARLAKGTVKSRLAHRPLMPRDLWTLKGLITFGIDGAVYRQRIKEMWGIEPLEFHGCTEAVLIAMQTWDREGMTFIPHLNFLEFIPEQELQKKDVVPTYQPETLLLDEVIPGRYEVVITSFQGGPFVRYRTGHLIEITSRRNSRLDIDIPQMIFLSRVDDQIDIAGFTRLSERVIWQAIENTGLAYKDWTARKEINGKPSLHIYLELEGNGVSPERVTASIHEELKKLDVPYAELESFTGLRPLTVTLLPRDAFRLFEQQTLSRAETSHLRPRHIDPPQSVIESLLGVTAEVASRTGQEVKV